MSFQVVKNIKAEGENILLRSGGSATFDFSAQGIDVDAHHRLYFTCEDVMTPAFKEETFGDKLYQLIEDALDTDHVGMDRYCLNLSEDTSRPFVKCTAVKRTWNGVPKMGYYSIADVVTNVWQLGVFAKAKDLQVQPGGYIRLRLERWDIKPGVAPQFTGNTPDHTEFLDIPTGSYEYTHLCKQIAIPNRQPRARRGLSAVSYRPER